MDRYDLAGSVKTLAACVWSAFPIWVWWVVIFDLRIKARILISALGVKDGAAVLIETRQARGDPDSVAPVTGGHMANDD
jgi:hypothetical protein